MNPKIVWIKRFFEWIFRHHLPILGYASFAIISIAFLKKTYLAGSGDDVPDLPSGWVVFLLALQGISVAGKSASTYIGTKFAGGNSDPQPKDQ